MLILRLSDHKVAEFALSRATNANSNPTSIEPAIAADSNKRVNNFGHVPSVPSQVTIAIFLNRIILSCFTGAEWRVKWRIVEDVLVGWPRLREPTDGIADVPPWGRGEKHEKKRKRGIGAAASLVTGRGVEEDSWQVNGHEHLVRLSYGQLSHVSRVPRCPFFRGTAPLLAAGGCCTIRPSPRRYHSPDIYVTFTSRFNTSAYVIESSIVWASGFISVKNIYWFRKKKKNTTAWRIRRFYRRTAWYFFDLPFARLSRLSWESDEIHVCDTQNIM